jgi:hypothetical protein
MQEQSTPGASPETLEIVHAFLERATRATEIADVNCAAGIALQALGELAPEID